MPFSDQSKIEILGFKAVIEDVDATLAGVNELSSDCTIQLMDAQAVAGYKHVLHATIHALIAFQKEYNIAHDLGMEICLRTSAQRQISKALQILGLKEGPCDICAVLVDCEIGLVQKLEEIFQRDDQVLLPQKDILIDIYDLSPLEIQLTDDLTSILMEQTTLLIIEK